MLSPGTCKVASGYNTGIGPYESISLPNKGLGIKYGSELDGKDPSDC